MKSAVVIQHTESVPTGGGNKGTASAQQHEYIENNEQREASSLKCNHTLVLLIKKVKYFVIANSRSLQADQNRFVEQISKPNQVEQRAYPMHWQQLIVSSND